MTRFTFLHSRLINDFSLHHPEIPLTAIAGQPDLVMVGACIALWNRPTSGQMVYIKNMKVINQMSQDTATGLGTIAIQRCTGYTAANGWTADASNIFKMASTQVALDAGIKCLTRVGSVTGGETIRTFTGAGNNMMNAVGSISRTYPLHMAKRLGSHRASLCLNTADVYDTGNGFSDDVQGIILNTDEGVALVPTTVSANVVYRFTITFRNVHGTYVMTEAIRPFAMMIPMLLWNGSADPTTVVRVEVQEIGSDDLCNFAVQKIDQIYPWKFYTDATSDCVGMNSHCALPSGIKVYENTFVGLYGSKAGAIMTNPSYRRNTQGWRGTGPTFASGTRMYGTVSSSEIVDNANAISEFVIRPGEGIALIQKTASGMGRYEVTMLFQTEAIAGGAATLTKNTGEFPASYTETGKSGSFGNRVTP